MNCYFYVMYSCRQKSTVFRLNRRRAELWELIVNCVVARSCKDPEPRAQQEQGEFMKQLTVRERLLASATFGACGALALIRSEESRGR